MDEIKAEKKRIRKDIKNRFKDLTPAEFSRKSESVLKKLISLPEWKNAETVLVFLSLPDEIRTDMIIEKAVSDGKKTAVPRIDNSDLVFHYIKPSESDLIIHPLGMAEPDASSPRFDPYKADEKTLALVPGLAFDSRCFRLGRGKGFYDRFLPLLGKSSPKIGIGYDFQKVDSVPARGP